MITLLLAALLAVQPFTVSGNFPRDLYGPLDDRNLTWGHAAAEVLPIRFSPPPGYRVRILKLRGDLVAMPRVIDAADPAPANGYAGVLMGFSTTSSAGAAECDFCATGCMLYIQDNLHGGEARRAPYDYSFRDERILLDRDNLLNLKLAAYLNTTGHPIHMEGTYTITFEWVLDR